MTTMMDLPGMEETYPEINFRIMNIFDRFYKIIRFIYHKI